jgi:hypothetical protein
MNQGRRGVDICATMLRLIIAGSTLSFFALLVLLSATRGRRVRLKEQWPDLVKVEVYALGFVFVVLATIFHWRLGQLTAAAVLALATLVFKLDPRARSARPARERARREVDTNF